MLRSNQSVNPLNGLRPRYTRMIKEPKISFASWKPWHSRNTTATHDPFDPPPDFDMSGIYLWAHFKNERQKKVDNNGQLHLNPNVIYIGQSKKVTRRLEGSRHEKIKEYIRDRIRRTCSAIELIENLNITSLNALCTHNKR